MLEIHLFVSPLGSRCLNRELELLSCQKDFSTTKICYQVIPLINHRTIQLALDYLNLTPTVKNQQAINILMNQITLDYQAALLQGKKRGIKFLCYLQSAILHDHQKYSDQLVTDAINEVKLDPEQFFLDRKCELINQSIKQMNTLVHEFKIQEPTTAILIDSQNEQYASIITDFSIHKLSKLLAKPNHLKLIPAPRS